MSKQEVPLSQLQDFLPPGSFHDVQHFLILHKVHLTITRNRKTVLGDYRHPFEGKNHRISVNGNLNPYSFLITLLHELAHLFTYERFGNRVLSHGIQWQQEFSQILSRFTGRGIFPEKVEQALQKSIKNPAASTCGDQQLLRVLREYDPVKKGVRTIEQLPIGMLFKIQGDRVFIRGERIRTRYKCQEKATKKWYLFHGLFEVSCLTDHANL